MHNPRLVGAGQSNDQIIGIRGHVYWVLRRVYLDVVRAAEVSRSRCLRRERRCSNDNAATPDTRYRRRSLLRCLAIDCHFFAPSTIGVFTTDNLGVWNRADINADFVLAVWHNGKLAGCFWLAPDHFQLGADFYVWVDDGKRQAALFVPAVAGEHRNTDDVA